MNSAEKRLSGLAGKVVKTVVPLAVSVLLVVWMLHKVDLREVAAIIRHGVEYRYIVAMMIITILSHTIRGIRWGIQLDAAGVPHVPVMTRCVSIYSAYALNLVFPYLGEAWRCVFISRRGPAKLSTVVGTDLGDRISDLIVILCLVVLSLFVARDQLRTFADHYAFGHEMAHYATDGTLWLTVLAVLAVAAGCLYFFRHTAVVRGMVQSARRIWTGFAVLFHMRGTAMYIVLTFGIWICYFLETYLCFYAFPFTRQLIDATGMYWGLLPGLVVFVFGSCSMAVPSNGGLGAWNLAVMFGLSLFGVSQADGAAYSIVCWSFQTATLILLGIYSAVYVLLTRRHSPAARVE